MPDYSAGSDVQMADFTVAHEALGQAHCEGGSLELGVTLGDLGAGFGELIHDWCFGGEDGIAILGRLLSRDAPAIDDDWKEVRVLEEYSLLSVPEV